MAVFSTQNRRFSENQKVSTPEDFLAERLRVLSVIPKHIGQDLTLEVSSEESEKRQTSVKNSGSTLVINPKILSDSSDDACRFLVGQIGAHLKVTRSSKDSIELAASNPQFASLQQALSNIRASNYACHALPSLKPAFSEAANRIATREITRLAQVHSELGYTPVTDQLIERYLNNWKQAKFSSNSEHSTPPNNLATNTKLAESYAATQKLVETYRNTYPSRIEANDPANVARYAKEAEKILREQIWPKLAALQKEEEKQAGASQMLKNLGNPKQQSPSGDKNKQANQQPTSDGKGQPDQAQSGQGKSDQSQETRGNSSNSDPKEKEQNKDDQSKLDNSVKEFSKQYQLSLSEQEQQELKQATQAVAAGQQKRVNQDQLSPELLEKIKESFDKLPAAEKQKLLEQAQQELESLNASSNKDGGEEEADLFNATNPPKEPTQAEKQGNNKANSSNDPKLNQFSAAAATILQRNLTEYDRAVIRNIHLVKRLEGKLKNELRQRLDPTPLDGFNTGTTVNFSARLREISRGTPGIISRAWERREDVCEEFDYAATFLIDLSSSMSEHGKIQAAFEAGVVLTESFRRVGIPLEVLGFNSKLFCFKDFLAPLDSKAKELLGGIVHSTGSSTDLGWALQEASKRLDLRTEKNRILIVLSDGEPYPSSEHSGDTFSMSVSVPQILERNQILLPIGLGIPTETLNRHFSGVPCFGDITVDGLAGTLARVIEGQVIKQRH